MLANQPSYYNKLNRAIGTSTSMMVVHLEVTSHVRNDPLTTPIRRTSDPSDRFVTPILKFLSPFPFTRQIHNHRLR